MDKNKFLIPASIIIGFIIVGWFSSRNPQTNTQTSPSTNQQTVSTTTGQPLTKSQTDAKTKCEASLQGLKDRWGNILGVYYDPQVDACIVKYDKKGTTYQSRIEEMHDIKD